MKFDNGPINPDLVMCTNQSMSQSLVKNVSESTVYFVEGGRGYHWPAETDRNEKPEVFFFRRAIRSTFAAKNQDPYLTIEPGVEAYFVLPRTRRFRIDPQEQAAWRSAVLQARAYERARDMGLEKVADYFEEESPTGAAAIICTKSAYDIGEKVVNTRDNPSGLLFDDVYEGGQGVYECADAVDKAEHASSSERPPLISRQAVREIGRGSGWKTATDDAIRFAKKYGPKIAGAAR